MVMTLQNLDIIPYEKDKFFIPEFFPKSFFQEREW